MADPDIRRLLDSDQPNDWQLALRNPNFGPEDMDHMLTRLKAEGDHYGPDLKYPEHQVTKKLPFTHQLVNHPEFKPHHLHQLMDIESSYPAGHFTDDAHQKLGGKIKTYGDELMTMVKSPAFDSSAIDKVLESPVHWLSESELDRLVQHPAFQAHHVDSVLKQLKDPRHEPSMGGVSPYLDDWLKEHPETSPEHLNRWLDWAADPENRKERGNGAFFGGIARHPNLADADVQRVIAGDHPRRDALQHRQLSDAQLKSFLSDPRFQRPLAPTGHPSEILYNQQRASPENLDLAARHPDARMRAAAAHHPNSPPTLLNRLAENDPSVLVRTKLAANPNAPPEALDRLARRSLSEWADNQDRHGHMDVLENVAQNPRLGPETIGHLIEERPNMGGGALLQQTLRQTLTHHPNLTAAHLQALTQDHRHHIAVAALQHPGVTPEMVKSAFKNPGLEGVNRNVVRDEILGNPDLNQHLGPEELRTWVHDDPRLESSGANAISRGLGHPAMPKDVLFERINDLSRPGMAEAAAVNPQLDANDLMEALTAPVNQGTPLGNSFKKAVLRNPNINAEHLAAAAHRAPDDVRAAVASHPRASPELLDAVHKAVIAERPPPGSPGGAFPETQMALAKNPNTAPETIATLALDDGSDMNATMEALGHHTVDDSTLELMAGHPVGELRQRAVEINRQRHPDQHFKERVETRLGTGKLRKIRDLIWAKDPVKGEARPKDLPPGDWSQGRVGSGNISAAKLQQVIDAAPSTAYNVSHSTWEGAQRHSSKPSKVFQINATDEHVRKMKAAGVYGTFLAMQKASETAEHPVVPGHTLGWVRWTGDLPSDRHEYKDRAVTPGLCETCLRPPSWHKSPPAPGVQVDEIQSDFGQDFVKLASEQAAQYGHDPVEAEREAEAKWPRAHQKVIGGILFGGRHPNEMLGEAFMQHLRDKGAHGTPVHIHDAETKAPLSGMSLGEEEGKPLPGHMQFTYNQLPKKMGMQPSTYGRLATQDNPDLKGKPTWEAPVRKALPPDWGQTGVGSDEGRASGFFWPADRHKPTGLVHLNSEGFHGSPCVHGDDCGKLDDAQRADSGNWESGFVLHPKHRAQYPGKTFFNRDEALQFLKDRESHVLAPDWDPYKPGAMRGALKDSGVKKFEEDLSTWLDSRSVVTDVGAQLGLAGSVDRHLLAAAALGFKAPEPGALRRALVETDDVFEAVRDTTGARPEAFAPVAALVKAEPEPSADRAPTSILPETESAEPVVAALERAFNRHDVKNIYLGGKHSAGSMLARDPVGGHRWLLKPGSGGQSPGLGITEEIASQSRREAGFYHLAQLLGIGNDLPRAEVVNMDGHDWAALAFLGEGWKNFDDVKRAHPGVAIEALERLRRYGLLHRWAVLDWIAGNVDRHGANLMLGPGGEVKLIDHGSSFAGPSFNPGHDPNSFVPFYLRYRVPRWSRVPPEEKLGLMAHLRDPQDQELRRWVRAIDEDAVIGILHADGLNPDPVVARLRQLKELSESENFFLALDRLWAGV